MDFLTVAVKVADQLRLAVVGAKCNKQQCQALGARVDRLVSELQRLPAQKYANICNSPVAIGLIGELDADVELVRQFGGKGFLKRMLFYSSDAEKLQEAQTRLDQVVGDMKLKLDLDTVQWQDARSADACAAQAVLERLEQGQADIKALLTYGLAAEDRRQQVAEEVQQEVADIKAMMTAFVKARDASSTASSSSGQTSGEAWVIPLHCRINPREVIFVQEEDDFGDMRRVELGTGAFGAVLKATYRGQQVAVKTLVLHYPKDKDSFCREVAVMSRLSHSNVARLLGAAIVQNGEKGMMVVELLEISLHNALYKPGPGKMLTITDKQSIVLQIASGMM